MTTLTDDGLDYLAAHAVGGIDEDINTVAVGTGTAPEAQTNTELDNEIYRATAAEDNARFVENDDDPTRHQGIIEVTGGMEVADGTEITEIGLVVPRGDAPDILVLREVRSPAIVDAGHVVSLGLPINANRS